MKIDLLGQMKALGIIRRRRVVMSPITPSKAQINMLAKTYLMIVRMWIEMVNGRILASYSQSLANSQRASDGLTQDRSVEAEIALEEAAKVAEQSMFSFAGLFRSFADMIQTWHLGRFVKQLVYSTKVDLTTQMTAADVGETMEDWVNRNMSLIRNVSDEIRAKISDIVFRGLQNRTPVREVAKEISNVTGLARNRALRIASDQTVKLSSALDQERQLQLGMTSFEWRHSGKVHYRPEHLARNDKVFKWNSEVGRNDPPGFAPFCGCKALGVLEAQP